LTRAPSLSIISISIFDKEGFCATHHQPDRSAVWFTGSVLVLIGCALLAVRAVAGRVAALDHELDGVI
jgi:hypothetical protein